MNDDTQMMLGDWAKHKPRKDYLMIAAIDPGVTGAIAFYVPGVKDRVATFDMPRVEDEVNAPALRDLLFRYKPEVVGIERVGPMPRDGVKQAWRFSAAYTTAKVVIALAGIKMLTFPPQVWKKAMNITIDKRPNEKAHARSNRAKERSRIRAIQLFPQCADQFALKKDNNRAEAALLVMHLDQILRLDP